MDFPSENLHRYKLNTSIYDYGYTIVHTFFAPDPYPGTQHVATWRTEAKLGVGAFGEVWRQREVGSGQLRAVKTIAKRDFNVRELEALVELQDRPDLFVIFFGWYDDQHATYIAMENVELGDLGKYMKENKEQAKAGAKEITRQVLRGLVVLHERRICHRDLKPQNILLVSALPVQVKITDFGISKLAIGTALKTRIGTVNYQAPEVSGVLLPRKLRSYTHAVDLWALGVVVHEVLTSEIPFLERNGDDVSMSDGFDTSDNAPSMDQDLLYEYCRNSSLFPTQALEAKAVSQVGIDFVKSLMAADPQNRVTASDALNNRWLIPISATLRIQLGLLAVRLDPVVRESLRLEQDLDAITRLLHSLAEGLKCSLCVKAIAMGYLKVVGLLLVTADDISYTPSSNNLPWLQLAAGCGKIDILNLMLHRGADINAASSKGSGLTALQAAAFGGDLATITFLLSHGADINAAPGASNGRTALQAAAGGGHVGAITLLLNRGADLHAAPCASGGRTALQAAAAGGHFDAIILLLVLGADLNAAPAAFFGRTALQAAAGGGHVAAIRLLLCHGADLNAAPGTSIGLTALQAAAGGGHVDAITLLLGRGAELNAAPGASHGLTALQAAAAGGHVNAIILLLSHGADLHAAPGAIGGVTALQAAAGRGHVDVIKLLLDHGANVNVASPSGDTALKTAARFGKVDAMKLLRENGATEN